MSPKAAQLADRQRRFMKRVYFEVQRLARRDQSALRRHAEVGSTLILNLHRVSPEVRPYSPPMQPEVFAELLEWLREETAVRMLGDLRRLEEGDRRGPSVVLSFDDGYKDFIEYAMPILDQAGTRANQNVIASCIETGRLPWNMQLVDFLNAAPASLVRSIRIPGFTARLATDDSLRKERFGAAIGNHLKRLSPSERAAAWSELQPLMDRVEVKRPTRMMSPEDVAQAAAAGHEIGAHSYSHESMALVDDEEFLADLAKCRSVLGRIGVDGKIYAFPNGSYRPEQLRLLEDSGVEHILLMGERPSRPSARVHTRLTLRGHSVAEVRARAAGLPSGHRP